MDGTREQPVGREQELDTIARFLSAREQLPAAAIVEGFAGVGKTTVWREAIGRAERSGYRVLTCRPASTEVHLLFGALSDLLVDDIAGVLPSLPAPQRRAIEVVLLLEDDRGRPAEPRTVAAGVLSLIRELARDQPVLLAIDDAQWLDPASAMVLEYVLRRLGDAPVAFLASWRIEPSSAGSIPGDQRGLDLARALETRPLRIALGPLSIGAIHRILRTQTGAAVPRPLLRRIHEASGGNPFYALEIARAMATGTADWATGEPLALSASLGDLILSRFDGLGEETRAALFVVSAVSPATVDVVEGVVGASAAGDPSAGRPGVDRPDR